MKKLLLPILATLPFAALASEAQAQNVHLSPDVKIGIFNGAGVQLGIADTLGMDAVYFSYARKYYDTDRYDETIDSYRLGLQHMFGDRENYGLQAEIGLATIVARSLPTVSYLIVVPMDLASVRVTCIC